MSMAVIDVVNFSWVSKRPYQKFIQVGVGKLETVKSWQDTNAGRYGYVRVQQPNTYGAWVYFLL